VVRNCIIEATLTGVEPFGNQFNIIAGNTYITKEGFGHLLSKIQGLRYTITFELPRIKDQSAAVVAIIRWSVNGSAWQEQRMDMPIKVNNYMGADGVLGKAERKARKWLYSTITGTDLGDGGVEEGEATVVSSKQPAPEIDKELERKQLMVKDCKTVAEVEALKEKYPDWPAELFAERLAELAAPDTGPDKKEHALSELKRIKHNMPIRERINKLKVQMDGNDPQGAIYMAAAEEIETLEKQLK